MHLLVIRFVLGAVVVSAFSALGEGFAPKRFAGIFGAAPSVALPALAMAFALEGPVRTAVEGRSMIAGGLAFLGYCGACIAAAKRPAVPVWMGAVAAWAVWGVLAFAGWTILNHLGGRP